MPARPTPPRLRIAAVPGKGRGVVAAEPIAAGALLDDPPVVVIPAREWAAVEPTVIGHYCFQWDDGTGSHAFVLGRPSLFNHAWDPNVICHKLMRSRRMEFLARRDIAAGEELTINYLGEPGARGSLWFDVRDGGG